MDNDVFNYQLPNNTVIFTDTLKENSPYISKYPRNHESLFIVTKGTLLYENNEKKNIICEGQVGYIARGSVDKSSAHMCGEVSYIAVNFYFDKENLIPTKTLPFKTLCSEGFAYNYKKLFNNALTAFLSKSPGYMTICNGILMQIIGYLYNEFKFKDVNLKKMQRIERALEYLRCHYSCSDFKISYLAEISYMSEKNFRRVFFEIYNKNPYDYLQEYRINQAEILLLNTSKSISDIASECGFSDIYSFSHSFKKHIGISPNKYKAELGL